MDLFDTLATIHSLECIASKDCLMTDDPLDGKKPAAWSIFDIVYVRSTPRTTISRLKFEKMIQAIFDREDGDDSKEYLVCPMLQSGLKKFPYPKIPIFMFHTPLQNYFSFSLMIQKEPVNFFIDRLPFHFLNNIILL